MSATDSRLSRKLKLRSNKARPTSELPWSRALVTGASAGIGRAMALRLAQAGVAVVLVSRDAERLEQLAQELQSNGAQKVEVLVADLTDPADLAKVQHRVAAPTGPVDLLINNAGLGYEGPFHTQDMAGVAETIDLNLVALVHLTHAALGPMVSRGQGQIMLLSSMASLQGMPMTAVYAATKAFITSLGEALYEELRGTGVVVTTVLPGLTHTDFHQRNRWDLERWPSMGWQDADAVAAAALDGAARNRPEVITGGLNRAMSVLSSKAPRRLRRTLIGWNARRS